MFVRLCCKSRMRIGQCLLLIHYIYITNLTVYIIHSLNVQRILPYKICCSRTCECNSTVCRTFLHAPDVDGYAVSVYIKAILPQKQKIKLIVLKKLERALLSQPPVEYFEVGEHLSSWQYSPASALTLF